MSVQTMPSSAFTVKYDGSAIHNHEMDVALLAPALMGLSKVVEYSAQIATSGEYSAQLKLKGNIKSGSITVELVTSAFSLFEQAKAMLLSENAAAIANISGIASTIGIVFALVKRFAGKSPDRVADADHGLKTLHFGNESITIQKHEYNIYMNIDVRENMYQVVKPLETSGIEVFKMIDDETEEVITVSKDDVEYFANPLIDHEINESTSTVILVIEKVVFKDNNKWTFSMGGSSFAASIQDEEFIQAIEQGKAFAKGDWLKVELRSIQSETNGKLKTTHEVIKVLQHLKKEQYKLDV